MKDFPEKDCASRSLQNGNYADYCDALSAERWSRLLEAARRMKRARSSSPIEQRHISREEAAPLAREELLR